MKWDKKGRNAIERIARNIAAYKGGKSCRGVEDCFVSFLHVREKTKNLDF